MLRCNAQIIAWGCSTVAECSPATPEIGVRFPVGAEYSSDRIICIGFSELYNSLPAPCDSQYHVNGGAVSSEVYLWWDVKEPTGPWVVDQFSCLCSSLCTLCAPLYGVDVHISLLGPGSLSAYIGRVMCP